MGHRMLPVAFFLTAPCCHGNSACVKDFFEIVAPTKGFSGLSHRMLLVEFFPDRSPLPRQRNFRKKFLRDFCAYRWDLGNGPLNAVGRIFLRPTLVAMATKFGTKWAITQLEQKIFATFMCDWQHSMTHPQKLSIGAKSYSPFSPKFRNKMGYKKFFDDGPSNAASRIFSRPNGANCIFF